MNDTESGFLACAIAETCRILGDDPSADQDFPLGKGDNIGRRRVMEEFVVHLCDCPVAEDGGFDLLLSWQQC